MLMRCSQSNISNNHQNGFSYLLETREEKLFVNMQHRLQQAGTNDRERRMLLTQLESRMETQKALVRFYSTHKKMLTSTHRRLVLPLVG